MQQAERSAWSEGDDGRDPTYRERLYPGPVVFVLVIGLAAIVAVAYGAAYGATWGWLAGLLLGLLGIGALIGTSTIVRVDDRVVRAGRARLPLSSVAEAHALDADAMRHARRHGDPRDYIVLRAWSSRRGVAIDLADSRDPHPRWVITSRHPDRLVAAIAQASAAAQDRPAVDG